MAENKELEIESLDATEIEDEDLEEVAGGVTNNNCNCSVQPVKK
jgi:hypothetical protein